MIMTEAMKIARIYVEGGGSAAKKRRFVRRTPFSIKSNLEGLIDPYFVDVICEGG